MLKLFKKFNLRDILDIIIIVSLIAFQVFLDLRLPDYMSEITKLVQSEGSKMNDILLNGGYMLLCAFGSLFAAIIVGYLTANLSARFSRKIRKDLFDKVERLSINEIKKFSVSSLITRSTNDITQIQMFLAMGIQLLFKAPITALWAVSKILRKNMEWSLVTGFGVLILLITIIILMLIVIPRFKKMQKLTDDLNNVTRENITGIRVVRAFNADNYQEDKFNEVNDTLTNTQLFTQRALSFISPTMYLVMYFLTLSIYFIGAYLIDGAMMADKLSLFSDMVVFSSYSMQVIISFVMLAVIFMILPRAQVSASRINEVLEEKETIIDGNKTSNTKESGIVEFKNVSFKYEDAKDYLLKDISFKVNKGETIAFIGSTGSGKSTLINLVPRFYDVSMGEILVDNINVKEYKQSELRNKIGYVSQKAVIFDGSVTSNVSYGDNGKKKEGIDKVKEAIKVAQAKHFVEKLDKTYDAHIAQGGTNVSGGQKQRISIARAIYRNPEIYIFDDTFSALDYKTDFNLRSELKKYTKDATVLIVAQRIGTIKNADKIMVLDEGKCVGFGTHKELLKNCKVYKQIALSQLSKEELDHEA